MRLRVLRVAGAALLVGPTVLAFQTGGYFSTARNWAGLLAWLLAAVALLAGDRTLPRTRPVRCALLALALFAVWTLASVTWSPIAGSAYAAAQIVFLYLGALLAATLILGDGAVRCAVEPVLAGGTLIVIGYGLSERLLPGILEFSRSVSAQGRLEQPLTYWNAMGEEAAIGLVLCARLAGDQGRTRWLRAASAAAAAPLGMGLYISFSRGALFACFAGVIALIFLAPSNTQLRALMLVLGAAILGAVVAAPMRGVTNLAGSLDTREAQGAIALAALAVIAIAAAITQCRLVSAVRERSLRLPRHAGRLTTAIVLGGLALAIAAGSGEPTGVPLSAGAARYATLQSDRYDYWDVALRAFGHEPVIGVGAGGWEVWWLRYRPYADGAQDAHSLELQTLAELGVVGVLLLGAFFGAVGVAARSAHRVAPAPAAGLIAGVVVWLVHSPLDWDWQMPAVTLIAVVLAGGVLALRELPRPEVPLG